MGEKLQGHPLLWGIIRRFLMAGAVSVTSEYYIAGRI